MSRYAEGTEVTAEKSRAEIERTLQRYGCEAFMFGWEGNHALLQFKAKERFVRFTLTMPDLSEFRMTDNYRTRNQAAQEKARDAEIRRRWRSLALGIKAKLDAVESEIATFEDEFMANIVLPDGQTVGQFMEPQIEEAYATGIMPSMLPALGPGSAE